ncbi:Uridine kinase [Candidatus Izimaplasma bacterium HR1]|jgi:uridine kinase|uniref:nucleoside kinase n=1 Tax=Candidatus Izimoplasma sp. HR1 TaxID=1541959 RepID=UPI0004F71A7D|nr:Uridine kinase [Candidatus Izimaplasma bacterium HR1]
MFTIKYNEKSVEYKEHIRVNELLENENKVYPVALVNNRLRELSYMFGYDAEVEFLTLDHPEAVHIYEASLRYLIAMAFKNIYPEYEIKFKYSVSRSIFCYVVNDNTIQIEEVLENIDKELKRLIALDIPFERMTKTVKEAKEFYQRNFYQDRIDILEYRPEKKVHFYRCNGYQNYVYSYMVPSTGYLTKYKMRPYDIGFVIQYPRAETDSKIPKFKNSPKYIETLRDASTWAHLVEADTIANLNRHVEKDSVVDFVHMCEAKHNAMLTEIGDLIKDNDDIRLIAIAGPSSSGKTTFSNRLRIELMTRGLKPVTISLDDYYLNREDIPTDKNGKVDLEHINTLDIELFNQNMTDLIKGIEVEMPVFDFTTKRRGGYRKLKVGTDNPIIIEGIHALNDKLTSSIPHEQTFKIYISPQLQMNLDDHNPISITNVRLLRRIVRDKQFRNASALRTIGMWESVRAGEFKWIYPNQEHADYVYNSGLQYELSVLKKYALPTLKEIANDSEFYITANRLIKFLKYFVDIPDEHVPCNSLLREFIGGSCFRE